jgi:hypothetical protein
VLPPEAESEVPEEAERAATFAAEHPDRQEVRIVAAATRTGASYCALRMRTHDTDDAVLTGPALAPGLVDLVRVTLNASGTLGPDDALEEEAP